MSGGRLAGLRGRLCADNPDLGARRFGRSRVAAAVARNGLERCIGFVCLLNSRGWLFVPGLAEPLWAGLAGRLSAATARTCRVLAIERDHVIAVLV